MLSKISNYLTDMIYETLAGVEPERREVIEYGVYMTVSEIVKIGVIIIIAAALRIVPFVVLIIAVFGVQRAFLGGIHAKTHLGCVITHCVIVFGVMALSFFLNIEKFYLLLFIAPFSYFTAYKYAPADLPQKPVRSKRQRRQLRIGGFILLSALFSAALFLTRVWSNIILFSCLIQALLMTPPAYGITKNKYSGEGV